MRTPELQLDWPMARALRAWFSAYEDRLGDAPPFSVWLAGGMAVSLYCGSRVTGDIDAELSRRMIVPTDLLVHADLPDGARKAVWFDVSYNPMFALLHEDYQVDAIRVPLDLRLTDVFVLTPVDLAVSKLVRFSDIDKVDIHMLAQAGLITSVALEARAAEAMAGYPGATNMLAYNVRDAVDIVKSVEEHDAEPPPP